jgi:hypothetical protein
MHATRALMHFIMRMRACSSRADLQLRDVALRIEELLLEPARALVRGQRVRLRAPLPLVGEVRLVEQPLQLGHLRLRRCRSSHAEPGGASGRVCVCACV